VLFEEGQPGERLFFLVKGDIDIFHHVGRDGEVLVDTVSVKLLGAHTDRTYAHR
jgi:hypothetical protein